MATMSNRDAMAADTAIGASPLAAFRTLVLADDTLQARLGAIERPDRYITDAIALAAAHGIPLEADAIRDAILPMGRPKPPPITLDRWPPRGWLPIHAVETGAAPAFDWAWFGAQALDAPFYGDMIRRFTARSFNRMFRVRTDLATLVDGRDAVIGPVPAGFIHHMSRCGSTLVAQMLGADPHHVVLSEPAPLDAVVRWALQSETPRDDQVTALRAVVAALGRDRSGQTRRVVFKLDSWHAVALPLFRAAFPETPWVFLYRDPVEILVSQQRQRGIHTVPGLLPASIVDIAGGAAMAADRYAACVLKRIGEAVLDHWPLDHSPSGGGLLVDYAEMPDAVVDRIAPHFGFVPDAGQRAAMMQVATRDAKAPDRRFTPDTTAKRRDATPEIEAARVLVDPVHARLETLRKASKP
ncbi:MULTISPECIES: sulfotransferase family protein [unclassified Sphingomonas]|uniref:sulfotransferase family protein n=1 Tax=unclassified Sphingomonas TaxID=196159 RepID=UPI0006F298FB|nr:MULTISPECIES: sulfotransferase family protein [unclassified Sphingomonas]KQS46267.1 hypothetical protein ASG20_18150 [Sphingomonas sp. Leaf198]TCP65985.1 hypothetical protein C8J43_10740 [Sphingomonas sp. PP-CE-1G-424]